MSVTTSLIAIAVHFITAGYASTVSPAGNQREAAYIEASQVRDTRGVLCWLLTGGHGSGQSTKLLLLRRGDAWCNG